MSKPCEGIVLTPIKCSEIVQTEPTVAKYVLPSARVKEAPTANDMMSETLFPSLGGIVKAQAPVLSFKKNVEIGIERAQKQVEEGTRREQITDPYEMTREELEKNGWDTFNLKPSKEWIAGFHEKNKAHSEVYVTEDGPLILTPEIVADDEKLRLYTQITNSNGSPIERKSRKLKYM